MDVVVGAQTDVGRVRSHNEDSFFTGQQIWAVADGMGGQAAGEVASAIVIDHLRAADATGPLAPDDLATLIATINASILDYARANPDAAGLGSTVAGIASITVGEVRHWSVFNVGDSRVYRFADGQLTRQTVDHNEAAELIETGQLDPADAADDPSRFILTRALGSRPAPRPDIRLLPQGADETFLICSDGLTSEVPDETIMAVLRNCPQPHEAAERLIDLALIHGAQDNVTAVVVKANHNADTGPLPVEADETTIPRPDAEETA